MPRKWTDEDLTLAVTSSLSIAEVLTKLGLTIRAGNYGTFHKHVKRLKLDTNDHRIENLRLLCPNCHALTDTWRGRNKNNLAV